MNSREREQLGKFKCEAEVSEAISNLPISITWNLVKLESWNAFIAETLESHVLTATEDKKQTQRG